MLQVYISMFTAHFKEPLKSPLIYEQKSLNAVPYATTLHVNAQDVCRRLRSHSFSVSLCQGVVWMASYHNLVAYLEIDKASFAE